MDNATRKEIEAILQLSEPRATLLTLMQRSRLLAIIEEQEREIERLRNALIECGLNDIKIATGLLERESKEESK
jgi:hypothetical protein